MASHKFVNIDNLEQVWKRLDEKIEKELKSEGVNSINGITGAPIITGDEYLNVSNDDKTISIVPTNKIKNTIAAIEEGGAADADGKYHIIKSVNGKAVEAMVDETGIVVNNDITIDARDIKVAEEGNMYDDNGYETIQEALDGIYDVMESVAYPTYINEIELELEDNNLVLKYSNTQQDSYEHMIENIKGIVYLDSEYDENTYHISTGDLVYAKNDVYQNGELFLDKGLYVKYENEFIKLNINSSNKAIVTNINNIDNIPVGDFVIVESDIAKSEYISAEWSTGGGDFIYTDLNIVDVQIVPDHSEFGMIVKTWLDENKTIDGETEQGGSPWYVSENNDGRYLHYPAGNGNFYTFNKFCNNYTVLLAKGTYIQTQVGLISVEKNLSSISGAYGDDYVSAKAIGTNIQVKATDRVKYIIDSIENNSFDISAKNVKLVEGTDVNDAIDGINIKISELADVSDELVKKDMTIGESINNIVDEISINEYQTQLSLNKKATHHEITEQFFTSDPLLKQEIKEGDTIHLQKTIYTTLAVQWLASGNALYTRGYMNEGDTEFSVYTNPNLNSESTIGNRWICGVDDSGTYIYDQYGEHDLGFAKFYGNELFKNTSYANLVQKAGFYIMAHKDGNSYQLIEQKNINISGDNYISVKEDGSNFKINFSNNLTAGDINYDESTTVVEILDTLIEENKPKYIEISSQSDLEEALNDENNIGYIFYVTNAPIASGIYIKTSNGLFKINGEFI